MQYFERAAAGHSVNGLADAEAAGVAQAAKKARAERGQLVFPEAELEWRQFWQARFYDFNVLTERKKREKLQYIASKSRGAWLSGASAGMAVEQLVELCSWEGIAADRSGVAQTKRQTQAPPSQIEGGAPALLRMDKWKLRAWKSDPTLCKPRKG